MLATRVIPVVLARGHEAVKGQRFDSWRSVGQVRQAVRVHQARNVDELILLSVTGQEPDIDLIRDIAADLFAPLCVGGGVRTLDHFRGLLRNGADKVCINTAAVETPELIEAAAKKFGRQAVVVSMDVKNGTVWTRCGRQNTGLDPVEWAGVLQERGCGEILLNSVERDGTLQGYDLQLLRQVARRVSIPVVACGGAGSYEDFRLALDAGAHAVAAGALWAFTDSTPAGAAEYLSRHGVPVRRKLVA